MAVATGWAQGQLIEAPTPDVPLAASATPEGVMDIQADSLSYDAARRLVIADGHIFVARGTDSVAGDYAEVDTLAETVHAKGNLVIHYQGNVWKGEEAVYNFRTGVGDFGQFELSADVYSITARDSRRVSPQKVELDGVVLTTCEPDNPEYSVRAASATLENNEILRAKHIRFQLGPVPFFYFPYVRANINAFDNFEFTPGMSSSMGPFLLTAYRHSINDIWTSRTHLDLRQKRGIGLGEDLLWKDPAGAYSGMARVYYTHDQEPWRNDSQRVEREDLIDRDRYWLHLDDRHNLTDRDYLITELNYVSDPWVLNDFFDDEYQNNVQPENRITLSHRGDRYTAGIGLNMRLNDFYGNVNRLPEAFLDFNRQQIFNTPFFYEGENTLSYLDRVFPDDSTRDDYNAFRFDSYNMVYWPTRHFGFLSLIPRAGYRGTYYSKTRESSTVTNVIPVLDEFGVTIGTTNEVEELLRDGAAVWRNLPELGLETSFKAFGSLYRGPTGIGEDEDLRHVAEPYANYTMRFEPNALPDELWAFDSIDDLDERNDLRLGMRNYLQTKRNGSLHNLAYLDVYTTLLMDPNKDQKSLGDIGFRSELRPLSWLYWDFDGAYDTQESGFRNFNTQVGLDASDVFTLGMDYRYTRDRRNQLAGDLMLLPEQRWSARLYARMDLDDSELEEHSYYLVHRTRCLGIGVGLRIRPEVGNTGEDDYTFWLRIWPLAFPQFMSSIGG
jgi:LPS-assembly protein